MGLKDLKNQYFFVNQVIKQVTKDNAKELGEALKDMEDAVKEQRVSNKIYNPWAYVETSNFLSEPVKAYFAKYQIDALHFLTYIAQTITKPSILKDTSDESFGEYLSDDINSFGDLQNSYILLMQRYQRELLDAKKLEKDLKDKLEIINKTTEDLEKQKNDLDKRKLELDKITNSKPSGNDLTTHNNNLKNYNEDLKKHQDNLKTNKDDINKIKTKLKSLPSKRDSFFEHPSLHYSIELIEQLKKYSSLTKLCFFFAYSYTKKAFDKSDTKFKGMELTSRSFAKTKEFRKHFYLAYDLFLHGILESTKKYYQTELLESIKNDNTNKRNPKRSDNLIKFSSILKKIIKENSDISKSLMDEGETYNLNHFDKLDKKFTPLKKVVGDSISDNILQQAIDKYSTEKFYDDLCNDKKSLKALKKQFIQISKDYLNNNQESNNILNKKLLLKSFEYARKQFAFSNKINKLKLSNKNFHIVGASVAAGYGAEMPWPYILQYMCDKVFGAGMFKFVNLSSTGATIKRALKLFEYLELNQSRGLMLVLAANDFHTLKKEEIDNKLPTFFKDQETFIKKYIEPNPNSPIVLSLPITSPEDKNAFPEPEYLREKFKEFGEKMAQKYKNLSYYEVPLESLDPKNITYDKLGLHPAEQEPFAKHLFEFVVEHMIKPTIIKDNLEHKKDNTKIEGLTLFQKLRNLNKADIIKYLETKYSQKVTKELDKLKVIAKSKTAICLKLFDNNGTMLVNDNNLNNFVKLSKDKLDDLNKHKLELENIKKDLDNRINSNPNPQQKNQIGAETNEYNKKLKQYEIDNKEANAINIHLIKAFELQTTKNNIAKNKGSDTVNLNNKYKFKF